MGLFDEIAGKAKEMLGGAGGETSGLLKGVMEMLGSGQAGGLQGLVQSFQQKGLGDIISSWVGTGQNLPISPDQMKEGLGSDLIQNLAAKAGVSPEEASAKLAEHLPGFIDKLTPDGTIPEGGLLEKGLEFLKGKLG
ncbi:MAG: DUF937 domain-containing protein [Desulfuromonadales bacterium]|nr:MAG: DUF937 domain-containing protein [Desulfuromonadales bacterium]